MKFMSFFNNRQGFMKMSRRKQSNRGVMWASLISVAVSSIALLMRRGGNRNTAPSLQNFVNNFTSKRNVPMMDDAALTEFSEELISKAMQNK